MRQWLNILGCLGLVVALTACGDRPGIKVPPPSLGGVTTAIQTAGELTAQAKTIAKVIHDKGTPAKSVPAKQLVGVLEQVDEAHRLALANVEKAQIKIDLAETERRELAAKVKYWQEKQRKALKELWFWRGLLIAALLWIFHKPILALGRKALGIPWLVLLSLVCDPGQLSASEDIPTLTAFAEPQYLATSHVWICLVALYAVILAGWVWINFCRPEDWRHWEYRNGKLYRSDR
jgi:hypothetical protein